MPGGRRPTLRGLCLVQLSVCLFACLPAYGTYLTYVPTFRLSHPSPVNRLICTEVSPRTTQAGQGVPHSTRYHVCAVYLMDAHFIEDAAKFMSASLACLSAMVQVSAYA